MTDLIARLRGNVGDDSANQDEAADEIERLRQENEQLKVALLNAASAVTVKEFQAALRQK
jgi:hypothetical protein